MRGLALICCVLCVLVMGFECIPGDSVSISIADEPVSISVVEVEGGVEITNTSEIAIIVYVRSPEGEQRFELAAGESITVTGITKPIEVATVSR